MNYYQIPNDPRNTLLNALKDQKVQSEETDEKEKKSFFEKELYVGPLEKTRRQRQAGQIVDPVNQQPEIQKPVIPVIATSNQNQGGGLLSEKDEKEVEERLNKDIETKAKYTKAGDFFANLGGLNRVLSKEQQAELQQSSPEDYNKVRLAARNKGIGEMLLLLSDALGGRDIAGRAMERRIAERPEKEDLTAAQQIKQEELRVIRKLEMLNGDIGQLSGYEKNIYDNYVKGDGNINPLNLAMAGLIGNNSYGMTPSPSGGNTNYTRTGKTTTDGKEIVLVNGKEYVLAE
jgi:hypothetical protein